MKFAILSDSQKVDEFTAINMKDFLVGILHSEIGSTGEPPEPSGDSPLGTEKRGKHAVGVANRKRPAVSSGQWPDETGQWPVPPRKYENPG